MVNNSDELQFSRNLEEATVALQINESEIKEIRKQLNLSVDIFAEKDAIYSFVPKDSRIPVAYFVDYRTNKDDIKMRGFSFAGVVIPLNIDQTGKVDFEKLKLYVKPKRESLVELIKPNARDRIYWARVYLPKI